jgi:capsular exopolysaccharide synthesis family protein
MNAQDSSLAASGAAPLQVAGFELGDVLRVLSERRWIILGATALGLILGIVATLMMTPLYRSTVLLEMNSEGSQVIAGVGAAKNQGVVQRAANQELLATQIGLLRSETLTRRVVQDLNLASDPAFGGEQGNRQQRVDRAAGVVMRNTVVEPVKGSLLIKVIHTSSDRALAAKVANGIADGFIASSLERKYDSSAYARQFLEDQLARTKASLEESERKLNDYAIRSGLFRTPGVVVDGRVAEGATLAASDLAQLSEALNQARVRRINAEQAYRNSGVTFAAEQAAGIADQMRQRADLSAQYEEKARLFKPDYPMMRELKARIDGLDAAIKSERARSSGNKRDELRGEFDAARQAEAQLTAKITAIKSEVQDERNRSIQYTILQRESDTNRQLYDALLQKYKEVGVAGGVGQSMMSIVDQAKPPARAFSPNLPFNAIAGLLLGLGVGIALAFVLHLLFDSIADPVDVRNKLHLPVLGVVPLDTEDRTLMEALADRKSDISEAYYSVRTALKFARPEGPPKSLLVTSTKAGEGKSTSAYAIASAMARIGSKVLLIDADLRKPTFVSSREDGYGLAHLLGSDEPMRPYLEATQIENLSLLPVGRYVGSAAELLSSNRLPVIIAESQDQFDMVVIDGPPVLGLTDAPLLGSAAEATAMVIESKASRTADIVEMIRRLSEAGSQLVGVILTKVASNGGSYGYNYYSYSYGSDGVGGRVSSEPGRALDLTRSEG